MHNAFVDKKKSNPNISLSRAMVYSEYLALNAISCMKSIILPNHVKNMDQFIKILVLITCAEKTFFKCACTAI